MMNKEVSNMDNIDKDTQEALKKKREKIADYMKKISNGNTSYFSEKWIEKRIINNEKRTDNN